VHYVKSEIDLEVYVVRFYVANDKEFDLISIMKCIWRRFTTRLRDLQLAFYKKL